MAISKLRRTTILITEYVPNISMPQKRVNILMPSNSKESRSTNPNTAQNNVCCWKILLWYFVWEKTYQMIHCQKSIDYLLSSRTSCKQHENNPVSQKEFSMRKRKKKLFVFTRKSKKKPWPFFAFSVYILWNLKLKHIRVRGQMERTFQISNGKTWEKGAKKI